MNGELRIGDAEVVVLIFSRVHISGHPPAP